MEITMRVDFGTIVGVLSVLVLFGACYNHLIAEAERRRWMDGFLSLAVALGVLMTLVGLACISWMAAALALACFTASGLPMMAGSIARYIQLRDRERRALMQEVRDGNDTQGVA